MRGPAPLDEPLSYPGERPRTSFVLRGDALEPLPEAFDASGRRAVLAIGSNACPSQLAAKFRARACSDVVVGLIADVAALTVRPSAHVSRSGYWPFAPKRRDGVVARCVLTLLDDEQVAVLDTTEPNYRRVVLDTRMHEVRLHDIRVHEVRADGFRFDEPVAVYESRHGVVDDDRLPDWTDPPPSQHALLGMLVRVLPDLRAHDAESLSDLLRQTGRAEEVTRSLQRHLHVRPSGLATLGQDERRSGRLPTPSANER